MHTKTHGDEIICIRPTFGKLVRRPEACVVRLLACFRFSNFTENNKSNAKIFFMSSQLPGHHSKEVSPHQDSSRTNDRFPVRRGDNDNQDQDEVSEQVPKNIVSRLTQ